MLPALDNFLHAKNLRYTFLSKILMIKKSCNLIEQGRTPSLTKPKKIVSDATFFWLLSQIHPSLSWNIDHQRMLQFNRTTATTGYNQPKVLVSHTTFSSWPIHAKHQDVHWFFPEILVMKESCNLIGWEAQLATPIQK